MVNLVKGLIIIAAVFAGCITHVTPAAAMELIYLSEYYPPHNYEENGRVTGASVEILELMWQQLEMKQDVSQIKIVPWARGMKRIKHEPNIVLFGMGYSPERMEFLNWVGPYYSHSLYLIGKKGRDYKIETLSDAAQYRVGAVREDMGHVMLKKKTFPMSSVQLSNSQKSLLKKLESDRIDLICYMEGVAFSAMPAFGLDPDDYTRVLKVFTFKSGYGFSKGIPLEILNAFQKALDDLKKEGKVLQVLEKYDIQ